MKQTLLIIWFILSCFFSDRSISVKEHYERVSSATVEAAAQNDTDWNTDFHSKSILPTRTASFSGENGGFTPTVRSNNSVRRTQVSQKFPFRVIKAGRIIDRQHFFVFLKILHLFPSGFNSINRYIHIICQLLI